MAREDRIFKLDSLYTVIKIGLLSFYPENTKLSIHNNEIYLQEPYASQSIVRYYFSDSKNDLHNLKDPIRDACSRYLNKDTVIIFQNCVAGLKKLMITYKNYKIVVDSLEAYSLCIEASISEMEEKEDIQNRNIYDEKWNEHVVNILINYFLELNNTDFKGNKSRLIESLEFLLSAYLVL